MKMKIIIILSLLFLACSEATVDKVFHGWMVKHGKSYSTSTQMKKHYEIFKKQLEYIKIFNSDGERSYKIGLNQFSDLDVNETVSCVSESDTPPYLLRSSSRRKYFIMNDDEVFLPDEVDQRKVDSVTSVKNQGNNCGACWAFAAVAAIETVVRMTDEHLISLSPQELIDCTDQVTGPSEINGCESGSMASAFFYVSEDDLRSEEHYPYKQEKQTSCLGNKTAGYSIDDYAYVDGRNGSDTVRKALLTYTLAATINIGNEFKSYQSGIFSGPCGTIKHAVAIIGYGVENGLKYWLIKNSWGVEWGEAGFARISSENDCGLLYVLMYPHVEDHKQQK